ncbi:unnamed protein product [Lactuca virosa]|uniref:Uncharacterized protein n=1 Tax=Lactuca virosa TaxID=75947 RepID=A0AAU9MYE3_9ASTR|nr:unnamed protein product [Lactuca virosa]
MSTAIMSDAMVMPAMQSQLVGIHLVSPKEVEFVECDCCGLIEECTMQHIQRTHERYQRNRICGLCGDANSEILRNKRFYEIVRNNRLISTEEAIACHMNLSIEVAKR